MINVLVTSVGGGVGQSVVDSISHLTSDYYIVGADISDKVYARNQCNNFIISPRISDSNYVDFLLSQCKRHSIDIVIPGHDGELELLSKNTELFKLQGVSIVVSPTKIVASSRNKYNWYKDYSNIINIVPTAMYDDFVLEPATFTEISFPVIAKPSAGSASSGIKIFLTLEELLKERLPAQESQNYVVQPYLMPKKDDPDYLVLEKAVNERRLLQLSEISCQIVYDEKSEIMGIFVSKNSLKNGVPVTIEPILDESILSIIEDIAHNLKREKVVGPVNIQGRLTEAGLVFFEMNLRFTGITGNRSQFGFNEVSCVIDAFVRNELQKLELKSNASRVGARQVACTTSYPLGGRVCDTILVTGASSWAAKNFILYLLRSRTSYKNIILSSRTPEVLKLYFAKSNHSNIDLDNVFFIDASELHLSQAIGVCDVVVNFASARPPHGASKIHQSMIFNLSLVDLIKKLAPGLVINMSSQSVYDQSVNGCLSEDALTNPDSPYSMSKLALEYAFSSVRRFSKGTEVINLRLGRVWGGEDADRTQFPYRLVDAILGNGAFEINNPKNRMNMLDVDDLSSAITLLIAIWESQGRVPETMNLGGVNTSIEEVVDALELVLDEKKLSRKPVHVNNTSNHEHSFIMSNKLAETHGIVPKTELTTSWRKIVDEYLSE